MKNTIKSINPANGELLEEYPNWGMAEIKPVIQRADRAFENWQQLSFKQRGEYFIRLAALLTQRKAQYARIMAKEMGKPVSQGEMEIEKCALVCEYYAQNTARYLQDRAVATEHSESFICFKPLGVIFMIMPWNFPFWQVFRGAAPIMMSGNTLVLKHASNVFGCALAIEQLFKDAGFPDAAFNTLLTGAASSAAIIAQPEVRAVTLTGSERAGQQVAMEAGRNLKKSVLELGGSDPYIVLEDADIDAAVASCGASRMLNGGQVCIAAKRFIVVDAVYQEFEAKILALMNTYALGEPLDYASSFGPMAKISLRDTLHQQVLRSVEEGAEIKLGGYIPEQPGAWYPATVLTSIKPEMTAFIEEIFGPVSVLIRVSNEQEAIALANQTDYGLGAAVFTQDPDKGRQIARDGINAGTCVVNGFVKSDPRLPFGGIKKSGYGREIGEFGLYEFVNIKTIVVN